MPASKKKKRAAALRGEVGFFRWLVGAAAGEQKQNHFHSPRNLPSKVAPGTFHFITFYFFILRRGNGAGDLRFTHYIAGKGGLGEVKTKGGERGFRSTTWRREIRKTRREDS